MDKDWDGIMDLKVLNWEEKIQRTPEEEAQWQETVKLLQKEQEERRRLKEEDPEAYRKLKEKEDQEMREYLDSVPFWD